MSKIFKKMNYKSEMRELLIINAPESFEAEVDLLEGVELFRDPAEVDKVPFALGFAITKEELDAASNALISKTEGDTLVWIAYPKKSSKKYTCEFDRDSGWDVLGSAGFEPVRQVAIDQDWSALRFRRVEFIKKLTRRNSMALSEEGKARTADNEIKLT